MHVLLVEDEPGIAQFISQGLREAGYVVDVATDGKKGWDYASTVEYDLMILDLLLPIMDGFQLLGKIRNHKIITPVLLLTARDNVEDRVQGLDRGADDYLVKPFAFSELLARLRALQRRPPLQLDTVLQVADLTMDTVKREVRRGGKLIELSPLEFKLLEYLMRHRDQVLSRTQILQHVWDLDFYSDSNIVDVYVGYVRRKIDRGFEQQILQTIRGVGYCLKLGEMND
ncbi:Transcriptional activator protein CzcR [Planktothrix tepida]|uniref:Transcriptional activator protein CzcR n=2 Tax=Planktothrix TaxID=54304 RepID=A0A9W4CKB7_9CYAN|nr:MULTISPECIES: response regulator transcription factor [Planktothrix]CAD5947593.1 Transcriptional activator protein CzcR [Planktothrix pseudagardhii]CAD5963029.1 Transcriptional activator protein CzcR [Planktothrix tepida]CUR34862.1 putative Two-component transcriptional regulator; putative transcriptional regulator involved in heavy-metal (Cu/Zn) homeostasis [Planktothrix tepida PCC 9214]